MKFKIGTDPEFFLYDTERKTYVSAHDMVPGDKKSPSKLPSGGAVQADGTAVEFNIEPAETTKEFSEKVLAAVMDIRKIVPSKYKFHFEPAITYLPKVWAEIPPHAKELGCDPDYRVTDLSKAEAPALLNAIADPKTMRTGSGHIHIGWTEKEETKIGTAHFLDCATMIRNLDYAWSGSATSAYRGNGTREQYYGRSFSFRCKPYGVEYRTPSNLWLKYPSQYKDVADIFLRAARETRDGMLSTPTHYLRHTHTLDI